MLKLNAVEQRVLGALMEKEVSTPEYYPLTLNSLIAACNQKSSREPVMAASEDEVRGALRSLEDADLVSVDHGSRVQRYEHRARTVFHLRRDETALLTLLLLRGPQTPGELRGRSDRLFAFDGMDTVMSALARMCSPQEQRPEPIAVLLPRQPGSKEARYVHALGDVALPPAPVPVQADTGSLAERVARLEADVSELRSLLESLSSTGNA